MDVDDIIVLTLSIWVFICTVIITAVDAYITLLLIGLLVVAEIGGYFINPETKRALNSVIYFMLFVFAVIVIKKILEVIG